MGMAIAEDPKSSQATEVAFLLRKLRRRLGLDARDMTSEQPYL